MALWKQFFKLFTRVISGVYFPFQSIGELIQILRRMLHFQPYETLSNHLLLEKIKILRIFTKILAKPTLYTKTRAVS